MEDLNRYVKKTMFFFKDQGSKYLLVGMNASLYSCGDNVFYEKIKISYRNIGYVNSFYRK